jgi:23S rRNA pseudoU1915 N3-methylase RlmH
MHTVAVAEHGTHIVSIRQEDIQSFAQHNGSSSLGLILGGRHGAKQLILQRCRLQLRAH